MGTEVQNHGLEAGITGRISLPGVTPRIRLGHHNQHSWL